MGSAKYGGGSSVGVRTPMKKCSVIFFGRGSSQGICTSDSTANDGDVVVTDSSVTLVSDSDDDGPLFSILKLSSTCLRYGVGLQSSSTASGQSDQMKSQQSMAACWQK